MSLIVRTATRLVTGFILIFGLYIITYGHITPGGGFAGGVILALGLVLTLLAFGKKFVDESALISQDAFKAVDVVGAGVFLLVALLGYFFATAGTERMFFANWVPHGTPFNLWSGGMLIFCNFAIGVKVGSCLFGVLVTMALFHNRRRGGFPAEED